MVVSRENELLTEIEHVRNAVNHYVEGMLKLKPDQIAQSVSKHVTKFGHYRARNSSKFVSRHFTFDDLLEMGWTDYDVWKKSDSETKVTIFDVSEKIAGAKVEAGWGIEYMLLNKNDEGKWLIHHIVCQSHSVWSN